MNSSNNGVTQVLRSSVCRILIKTRNVRTDFLCRTIKTNEGEILIAVIADGAGSTSEGGRGAEIACETFVEQISGFLNSGNASVRSLNADFGKLWISHFQKQICGSGA